MTAPDPCPTCGTPGPAPLAVGDVLYGFCGGAFGRDSYGDKTVEAIGRDWVVAREGSRPVYADGDPAHLTRYRTPEETL